MSDDPTLHELLASIDAVQGLYPGGIPEVLLSAPIQEPSSSLEPIACTRWGAERSNCLFVVGTGDVPSPEEGPAWELLLAAVTKGMGRPGESVAIIHVSEGQSENEALLDEIRSVGPKVVVMLGGGLVPLLGGNEAGRGWFQLGGSNTLVTHRLLAVLSDAQLKREFWHDLKAVLKELGTDS